MTVSKSYMKINHIKNGKRVIVAGLVITRQRPSTASGIIFATLEDETGIANVIIWPKLFNHYRRETLASRLLFVEGALQREGIVIHIIAQRLFDITDRLMALADPTTETKKSENTTSKISEKMYSSRNFH